VLPLSSVMHFSIIFHLKLGIFITPLPWRLSLVRCILLISQVSVLLIWTLFLNLFCQWILLLEYLVCFEKLSACRRAPHHCYCQCFTRCRECLFCFKNGCSYTRCLKAWEWYRRYVKFSTHLQFTFPGKSAWACGCWPTLYSSLYV